MSHQSTHHHYSLLNSIPQTQPHHHQPNLTVPIKHEIDSDDENVVLISPLPEVVHTPEEYDPECQCDTCQLVRRLQAECTCEECRGTGQPDQSSENVPIANAVSPTNAQPSSSSIQNNDASTSEHTNANDLPDDHRSGSSTPDYLPPFFDDESGDSGSDDSENDDDSVDDRDSSENESANSDKDGKDPTSFKCPKCAMTFTEKHNLIRHYRCVHQEWKPYYCRWPNCNITSALKDSVIRHANTIHFKSKNKQKANKYVAKRNEAPPKDPGLEQIVAIKIVREKKKRINSRSVCPRCGRKLSFNHLQSQIRSHAKPGYRCTWSKCGFFYSHLKIAKEHISSDHLQDEKANSEQTNQYLVKVNPKTNKTTKVTSKPRSQREEDHHHDNSGDEEDDFNLNNLDVVDNSSIKPTSTFNSNCPKCGRNFRAQGQFTQHYRTHENIGFRCTKCGAFYSQFNFAKKHLLIEHFKDKLVNATEINELIIKVDPNMTKSYEIHETIQNNDASTSEYHINGNDQQDGDRPGSSTPDYLPPFFDDDERGDSSSDDSEDDDVSVDNLKENNDDTSGNNSNASDHAFSKLSSSKCLKRSYDESQHFNKHTKTNDSKRKHHKCPHCERKLPPEHIKNHIRTHSYSGFRCVWTNCGFFYARLRNAKKHVCVDHLKVETANSGETNRYLVKVDSRTGETSKIRTRKRHEIPTQQINANDRLSDRAKGSKSDYLPPFFDNESGDSSSDYCEDDYSIDGDDEDYSELDQVNEDNADDDSDSDYAFSEPLKRSNTKSSSKHSSKTIHSKSSHKCKPCDQHFSSITSLKRHYRTIHQQLDSYYCKWSKCDFIAARQDSVIKHITVQHFNHRQNVKKANLYVGKRKLGTNDGIDGKVCPKCKRKFLSKGRLEIHLLSHKKTGFRCQWPKCNFFYSLLAEVKKHVCADHLEGKVEITNTEKINRYFVKVNPRTGETFKIMTKKRLDLNLTDNSTQPSTSCDAHRASVTNLDTNPRDASSSNENESDYNENDSSNSDSDKSSKVSNQTNSFDCPKCESSFRERHRLLRHYRSVHLDWKPYYCKWPKCDFVAGVDDSVVSHASQKHHQNRQKARSFLGIRKMSTSPPKDPIYESLLRKTFHFNCPKCGRNIKNAGHFKLHLAIHKKVGFRCTWPQCGYFYSELTFVKQHIRKEHFMGKPVNASAIHEHFVKVDPKTGRTSRIQCRAARVRTDDEEDSNDDDDGET